MRHGASAVSAVGLHTAAVSPVGLPAETPVVSPVGLPTGAVSPAGLPTHGADTLGAAFGLVLIGTLQPPHHTVQSVNVATTGT